MVIEKILKIVIYVVVMLFVYGLIKELLVGLGVKVLVVKFKEVGEVECVFI